MSLINIINLSFLFLIIFFGVINIGVISNKLIFKIDDYIENNIILGLLSLCFITGICLSFKLFDLYIIKGLIIISYLIFFFYPKNKFSFKIFKIDKLIVLLILIFTFFSSLKNNFYTLDDINGYFFTINNYITKFNIYNTDLRARDYFAYPFYHVFNALFISISDFYSAIFFDIFFGSSIILFTSLRNLKNNKIIKSIALLIIFISYIKFLETNTATILCIAILITILFKLEKFYKNNESLIYIFILSSFLISLKFTNLASFTNILVFVILIEKIIHKKINTSLIKAILYSIIFVLPWAIYSFQIFSTPLTELFASPYVYFENDTFKELNIKFTHNINYLEFIINRQILLTLILFLIYFFICKEKIFFKLSLLFSFLISYLVLSLIFFSDNSNFLRYMQVFFAANTLYLFIKIVNEIDNKKVNFKLLIIFFITCILSVRINQNVSNYMHYALNNLNYLFKNDYKTYYHNVKKYHDIEEIYPKNYSFELNDISDYVKSTNLLLIVSRPYLFNFEKNINNIIDFVEFKFGYSIVKNPYPLLGDLNEKNNFFRKRNIKYILMEKEYIQNNSLQLIMKNILNNNNNNIIIDSYGRVTSVFGQEFFYDDLWDFINNKMDKFILKETDRFILYKLNF